ncbi:hypothetical protein GGI07_001906 [Coemansia sp. Benny D115]|nr:hypothetical protein GGI07_001906 [Coemansia sp. Benny D115]
MPAAENDLTELFIRSYKCTGDVPPALVGSSVTYLAGRAYVFGGRALHSGKLSNDIYVCELRSFVWRRIEFNDNSAASTPRVPGLPPASHAVPHQCPPPSPRFFHSSTAFKQYLVVFGGMGLDSDTDGAGPVGSTAPLAATAGGAAAQAAGIQDDRHQQSFQMRTTKTLLGDIAVFDTQQECWLSLRALDSERADDVDAAELDEATSGSTSPSPRYAHLATLFGSRLLVVGGQDLEEQYVEELNVFDLRLGRWVRRAPFPRAVGLYRSFVARVPDTGATLLYSNYSFASVKRALYTLSAPPECTLKEISDQLVGNPPGLRFPRGHLVDAHTIVMTGTLISTEGHSELSIWALDSNTLQWTPISCGAKFRAGSWNQSVVDPSTNTLVLFGDSRRDLTYDYQRRRLNYGEIRTVDLRALGYLRLPSPTPSLEPVGAAASIAAARAASSALERTASIGSSGKASASPSLGPLLGGSTASLGVEVGLQLLFFSQFSDAEVFGSDGVRAASANSGLLRARWPTQAQMWLVADAAASAGSTKDGARAADDSSKRAHRRTHRPESSLISGDYTVESDDAVAPAESGPKRFFIEGSREAICVLLFYLYTDRIDPQARFGLQAVGSEPAVGQAEELATAGVLGELLVIARKYAINKLALRTVNLLRYKVTELTAPIIYEAALRADHHGLQARCVIALKDHIAAFRVDRKSTLYMITNASRASLIRYFPKLNTEETATMFADDAQTLSPATADRPGYQYYAQQSQPGAESRQRSTSDAFLGADYGGMRGGPGGSFPVPSPSASPASTLRSNPTRSPFAAAEHGGVHARRPWETAMMNSPVITSPANSARYNGQSPDVRSMGADPKRLSNISPLVNQSLPEDAAVSYSQDAAAEMSSAASHSHASNRMSRYLGGGVGVGSLDSSSDRRPSDSSASETSSLHQLQLQQQQPPQQSSRSLIFRPWSKMKKIASSSQVSSDSLPPMPNQSSYSGN